MTTTRAKRSRKQQAAAAKTVDVFASAIQACNITSRKAVSQIVLDFLHGKGYPTATEDSNFTDDIVVTPNARRSWAFSLRDIVSRRGCDPGPFGAEDCANATTVGDIVDALAGALHVS